MNTTFKSEVNKKSIVTKSKTNKSELEINPLLDTAQGTLAIGDFEGALKEVQPYLSSKDPIVRNDAHRIAGLACFQLKKYKDAENYWEAVVKAKLNERWNDWFNLCTSATMNRDFSRGKDAFETMVEVSKKLGKESDMWQTFANLIYYYMRALIDNSQYDAALEQLEKLADFYKNLPVTDRTYVVVATGSFPPSLDDVLDVAKPIFEHMGKKTSTAWLKDFASKLDEEGKQTIEKYL